MFSRIVTVIIVIVFILITLATVHAESYLLIDSQTKAVLSLSPEADAVLQPGQEKIILSTEFRDIQLMYHPSYYFWIDDRFVANTQKLSDEALEVISKQEKIAERIWIDEYLFDIAIEELRKEGKAFKHHKKREE